MFYYSLSETLTHSQFLDQERIRYPHIVLLILLSLFLLATVFKQT